MKNIGISQPSDFFTDHVDLRPTMMFLTGLRDDYEHDGRVILELLDPNIVPRNLHSPTLRQLGQIYKQINAPFGELSESALKVSTYAILSDSTGDATYSKLENNITSWTEERDALASQIKSMLENAEFSGDSIDERQAFDLIFEGQVLLDQANFCALRPNICSFF